MKKYKQYTDDQMIEAVRTSTSYAQVMEKLDISGGSSYDTIRRYVKKLDLSTDHFKGQAWNKGDVLGPKYSIEEYLMNKRSITSHKLRLRLISEKIFKEECSSCRLSEWLGQPIPLELDHIDGNHKNNSLDNLRILCPNCHVFTPTYKTKNRK